MGRITFKAREGEGGNWEPLPKGKYQFQIDKTEYRPAKSEDKFPSLRVMGVVDGGVHDGKKYSDFFSMHPKAGWNIERLLLACDVDYEKSAAGKDEEDKDVYDFAFDDDDLIGARYEAEVGIREYEGKPQNTFNIIVPPLEEEETADEPKPVDEAVKEPEQPAAAATGRRARRRV